MSSSLDISRTSTTRPGHLYSFCSSQIFFARESSGRLTMWSARLNFSRQIQSFIDSVFVSHKRLPEATPGPWCRRRRRNHSCRDSSRCSACPDSLTQLPLLWGREDTKKESHSRRPLMKPPTTCDRQSSIIAAISNASPFTN